MDGGAIQLIEEAADVPVAAVRGLEESCAIIERNEGSSSTSRPASLRLVREKALQHQ